MRRAPRAGRVCAAALSAVCVVWVGCGGGGSSGSGAGPTTTRTVTTSTTTTTVPGGGRTLCATVDVNLDTATRGAGIITFLLDFPEELVEMPELPDAADDDPLLAGTLACRPQLPEPFCCKTGVPGATVIAGLETSDPGDRKLLGAVGAPRNATDLVPFDGQQKPLMTCGFACVPGAARPPVRDDFSGAVQTTATARVDGSLLGGVEISLAVTVAGP